MAIIIIYALLSILALIAVYWLSNRSKVKTLDMIADGCSDDALEDRIDDLSLWATAGKVLAGLAWIKIVSGLIVFLLA